MNHATLRAALAAAQADARPLVKSALGGKVKPRHRDAMEHWWHYVPTEKVMEESARLRAAHGLTLEWAGTVLGPHGLVVTSWRLTHTASGEERLYPYEAPPFTDSETPTHAVLGTTRHVERAIHLLVFQIPCVEEPRVGDIVEGGVVVGRRGEPGAAEAERRELDARHGPMPEWADPGQVEGEPDGGLVDPGPLGGEDDHDPDELADEADEAALAGAVVDEVALWAAVKASGRKLGDLLAEAHEGVEDDVDWARARLSPPRRARLVAFMQGKGWVL